MVNMLIFCIKYSNRLIPLFLLILTISEGRKWLWRGW